MERFVAVLIEHTAGKFPLWLTPDQVAILPISEKFNDYAQEVKDYLKRYDVRAIVDERNEKIGRKIRDNEMKRIPYMLIVGEKEAENREVSVRKQGEGDQGTERSTVNHYRTVLLIVGSRIFQLETFGQVVIYLNGTQLPTAADSILNHKVQFRTVESSFTIFHSGFQSLFFTSLDNSLFCRPDQVKDEFLRVMDIISIVFQSMHFGKVIP